MNKEKKVNDLFAFASGILDSLEGLKGQSKNIIKNKIAEKFIDTYQLVSREDFEELKAMIRKTREENNSLKKKISVLEKKIKK